MVSLQCRLRSPDQPAAPHQRRPRSSIRMQYNSQCATRRRCPSCMRPARLRACTLSFCTCAASRCAPCLAATCERYLEWRRPQTLTCHQPARSTTSILILFIAGLPMTSVCHTVRRWIVHVNALLLQSTGVDSLSAEPFAQEYGGLEAARGAIEAPCNLSAIQLRGRTALSCLIGARRTARSAE